MNGAAVVTANRAGEGRGRMSLVMGRTTTI